jgi:N-acyl amino acid synthase of PEP-CTERM/exosortase system
MPRTSEPSALAPPQFQFLVGQRRGSDAGNIAVTTISPEGVEFAPNFRSREGRFGRDEALMRSVFELRFQVYCLECGFLPSAAYPDRLESDEHDSRSAHFCAFNLNDELVGYVRLVPPGVQQAFPFQSHCTVSLEGVPLAEPSKSVEISRLMVRKDYRRRRGDILSGVTADEGRAFAEHEKRDGSPQILLSLYRQMYAFSLKNGIRHWYAAMERPLARALMRMNFAFRQLGPQTDYYGPVAPYRADLPELEACLSECNPSLLAWLRQPGTTG